MSLPNPEEIKILHAEKNVLRAMIDDLFVATGHPVDLIVMELIRAAAQRANEFGIPLDVCLDQFEGEYQ